MPSSERVTIREVAELANCGIATASRVLNDSGSVSEKTKARVLQAAESLNFSFNEIGRSLRSNHTKTIGCLIPSLQNPVFAKAVQQIQASLIGEGHYQMFLVCSNYDAKLEQEAVEALLAKNVDGLILTLSQSEQNTTLARIKASGKPYCLLFNETSADMPYSAMNNAKAAAQVAKQFHALGHQQLAFVALRFATSDRSISRYRGFCEKAASLGMRTPRLIEVDESGDALISSLGAFLSQHVDVTGVFASNDLLAIQVMQAARSIGLQVPKHLSVVGFDGLDVGKMLAPSLATIETFPDQMGAAAAKYVLTQLSAESPITSFSHDQTFEFRPGGSLTAPGRRPALSRA